MYEVWATRGLVPHRAFASVERLTIKLMRLQLRMKASWLGTLRVEGTLANWPEGGRRACWVDVPSVSCSIYDTNLDHEHKCRYDGCNSLYYLLFVLALVLLVLQAHLDSACDRGLLVLVVIIVHIDIATGSVRV